MWKILDEKLMEITDNVPKIKLRLSKHGECLNSSYNISSSLTKFKAKSEKLWTFFKNIRQKKIIILKLKQKIIKWVS